MFPGMVTLARYVDCEQLHILSNVSSTARSGSKHLEFLLDKKLINLKPSTTLRFAYTEATIDHSIKQIEDELNDIGTDTQIGPIVEEPREKMLLSPASGAVIAERLKIPEAQMEIDRAVWQIERTITAQQEKGRKGN